MRLLLYCRIAQMQFFDFFCYAVDLFFFSFANVSQPSLNRYAPNLTVSVTVGEELLFISFGTLNRGLLTYLPKSQINEMRNSAPAIQAKRQYVFILGLSLTAGHLKFYIILNFYTIIKASIAVKNSLCVMRTTWKL